MTDDQQPESPDVDELYANYLETCRRLRVKPVTLDRAHQLFEEWGQAIRDAVRTKH